MGTSPALTVQCAKLPPFDNSTPFFEALHRYWATKPSVRPGSRRPQPRCGARRLRHHAYRWRQVALLPTSAVLDARTAVVISRSSR